MQSELKDSARDRTQSQIQAIKESARSEVIRLENSLKNSELTNAELTASNQIL
jgi:hypothetical protein